MQTKIINSKIINLLILVLFITQPIIFILKNIHFYPIKSLINPLLLSLILSAFIICLFYSSKKFFKIDLTRLIIFFPILWFCQFYYFDILELIEFDGGIQSYQKILFICFIIAISITITFFSKKNFLIFFINLNILLIIFTFIATFQSNFFQESKKNIIFHSSEYFDLKNYKEPNEIKYRNIYFVILDEMTSAKTYNDLGFNFNSQISKFEALGYQHLSGSKSSYFSTQYTIGSIFNMEYYKENVFIEEENFYPFNLYLNNSPNLLKILNYYDYKFWFTDNQYAKCTSSSEVTCLGRHKFLESILFDESLKIFFENSFMKPILRKIKFRISSYSKKKTEVQKTLDFIKKNKSILKDRNNFFWIHNMNPHYPLRDPDCNIINVPNTTIKDSHYINATKCTLKAIDEMIIEINSSDPDAIVVFQADHGFSKYNINGLFDRRVFEIFNLIKMPKSCYRKIDKDSGSVTTINLVFSCFRHTKNKTYENKSFIVKERNSNGTIFKKLN